MSRNWYENNQALRQRIFYAAKEGFSKQLAATLKEVKNDHQRDNLVNQEFYEDDRQIYTPLIVAARYGRYDVVQVLLTQFCPDLEKEGCIKFDGHIIEGATALWCAAGSGHLAIVKLLIEHGADVNHRTKTDSTPVRAACFDGRLDIIQYLVHHNADINLANTYNNTCLMISAYKGYNDVVAFLLDKEALVNEQAHCGATALHYASECGHVEVCSALLDYGAVLKNNEYGMTPVIAAAERTREAVVQMFHSRPGLLTKEEKIEALELMGASYANDKDNYSLVNAFHYLMFAMELRHEDPENLIRKPVLPTIPAYEYWVECQTVQDLQAIKFNHNSLHMESLTIRERILGKQCPEVAHSVVFRGAVCADNRRFDRCESLWMHALNLKQINNLSVQRDLLRFAQLFSQMLSMNETLRLNNVIDILAACVLELGANQTKISNPGPKDDLEIICGEYELNIVTVLYIITIITKLLKLKTTEVSQEEITTIYRLVYKLNQLAVKLRDDQSLLHLAVNGVTPVDDFHTDDICRFPCVETVKLLLKCGASISAVDCDRNTPLHTLTSTLQSAAIRMSDSDVRNVVKEITELFIEAGIHLDAVNSEGLKASQVCIQILIFLDSVEQFIKNYEMKSICLKCLAARCIAQHRISYKGNVPKNLEVFVQIHCADKF